MTGIPALPAEKTGAEIEAQEFSHEVRNVLYQSHHRMEESLRRWLCAVARSPEVDAFCQPYVANKVVQKQWGNVDIDEKVYCIVQRLCQLSHPQGISKEASRTISRQYISAFGRHIVHMYERSCCSHKDKALPFNDSLCLLQMVLVNGCQEGVRCALGDLILSVMLSHDSTTLENDLPGPALLAAQSGDISLLARIFSNTNMDQTSPQEVRTRGFEGAMLGARLDVVRFIVEPRNHLPKYDPRCWYDTLDWTPGILRSQSVNFSAQLFELVAPRVKYRDIIESRFNYNTLLVQVASGSPQRVDVAEWLSGKEHAKREDYPKTLTSMRGPRRIRASYFDGPSGLATSRLFVYF